MTSTKRTSVNTVLFIETIKYRVLHYRAPYSLISCFSIVLWSCQVNKVKLSTEFCEWCYLLLFLNLKRIQNYTYYLKPQDRNACKRILLQYYSGINYLKEKGPDQFSQKWFVTDWFLVRKKCTVQYLHQHNRMASTRVWIQLCSCSFPKRLSHLIQLL